MVRWVLPFLAVQNRCIRSQCTKFCRNQVDILWRCVRTEEARRKNLSIVVLIIRSFADQILIQLPIKNNIFSDIAKSNQIYCLETIFAFERNICWLYFSQGSTIFHIRCFFYDFCSHFVENYHTFMKKNLIKNYENESFIAFIFYKKLIS